MYKILVIDDEKTNLTLASEILSDNYSVSTVPSAKIALKYLENHTPDLILLDVIMPEMSGLEFMKLLSESKLYSDIPVIFLTANLDAQTEKDCFAAGAMDFILKPLHKSTLENRINHSIELFSLRKSLEERVEQKVKTITNMQETIIMSFANIIEARDGSTGEHVKRTRDYVEMIAFELKKRNIYSETLTSDFIDIMVKATVLHDVGKIGIPDNILLKPGKLDNQEFEIIKTHCEIGAKLINETMRGIEDPKFISMAHDIALNHHEKWNGTGYPNNISGEDIPLPARIMAIADVFDALTSKRCYKTPMPLEKAFTIIEDGKGTHFDPLITDVFLDIKDCISELCE